MEYARAVETWTAGGCSIRLNVEAKLLPKERTCTSRQVESTAESTSIYCGQTHIVDARDLNCQMMVCHPLPHLLSHTHSFSPIALAFSLISLPLSSPHPLLSLSLMSPHEQVQLSMKLTESEPNHFSLIRFIYDESH